MQTQTTFNRYAHDRPGNVLGRLKKAFGKATSMQRKQSLIRRFAVVEKRVLKVLNLVSTPPASTLIH